MENDITANPDYQLIMSFLKSIRPGDMSDEAATQLKMIGERIQSGGSLSDQEREMFQSVMGAMPQMPMDQGPMATGAARARCRMRTDAKCSRWIKTAQPTLRERPSSAMAKTSTVAIQRRK
jgi:hypothetical protein